MAVDLKFDFSDTKKISNALKAAGTKIHLIMARAVNHTGAKARTAMIKALVPQTGLKRRTMDKALKATKAFNGSNFEINAKGGNVRLKFFGARETRKGVSAAPWNKRRVYPSSFMKGGRFPKRVQGKIPQGVVWQRTGGSRFPVRTLRSGLFIPTEMVTGPSEAAFHAVVDRDLNKRIAHELYRVLG
jgi:hypothetical protein